MAITWNWYADAGLAVPLTTLSVQQSNAQPYKTAKVYFGSTATGKTLRADSNPGVDAIVVSLVDAAPASGLEPTDVRMALSEAGLASAVPGDPVSIGTTLSSGAGGAVVLWLRFFGSALALQLHTDLKLQTNALAET